MARSRHANWSRTASGATSAPGPTPLRTAAPESQVLRLQRTAGNRAVTALLARDPKTQPPPAKPPPPKKPPPKQTYATLGAMDPIPIESAQLGLTRPMRRNREKDEPTSAMSEVVITSFLGDHSNELFKKSLWGEPFSAEVVFVKGPDGQPYMKIKLTNAMISSYSVGGHGGDAHDKPMESWTLNAEKIEFETLGGGEAAP